MATDSEAKSVHSPDADSEVEAVIDSPIIDYSPMLPNIIVQYFTHCNAPPTPPAPTPIASATDCDKPAAP